MSSIRNETHGNGVVKHQDPNNNTQVEQRKGKSEYRNIICPKGDNMITLSDLIHHDVPNGAMLLEFPSTSNKNLRFVNNNKYLIYDFPPPTAFYNEYLLPLRACPVAGDRIPLLLSGYPIKALEDHWKRWVPGYKPPVIQPAEDVINYNYDVFITTFPHEHLPASRHAVDPDSHYKLLSKGCIPYMGTSHPRHMTSQSCTFPCMVKAAHGLATKGTFRAETREELDCILSELAENLSLGEPPVITEVIEGIEGNYCLQFYLFKTGEVHWFGATRQVIGDQYVWGGGVLHFDEQDHLKETLWETVRPVKEYLHKEGYFGIVGIDILTNKHGQFVVDVNPRINGSTPQVLMAPRIAALGYGVSVYLSKRVFPFTAEELVERANKINGEGEARVVVLSLADVESSCEAHVVVFAETEDGARKVYDGLGREM